MKKFIVFPPWWSSAIVCANNAIIIFLRHSCGCIFPDGRRERRGGRCAPPRSGNRCKSVGMLNNKFKKIRNCIISVNPARPET